MSDIPEDIRKAAEACLLPFKWDITTERVARALMAERERCAKIAEEQAGAIRLGGISAWSGATNIARKIRGT